MKYNKKVVTAFYKEFEIPEPCYEYHFHEERLWRFDVCWPEFKLAIEVQGGIWIRGKHSRGAGMKKDWEKYNAAAIAGWRILYCEPQDLCMTNMATLIRAAIGNSLMA